MFFLNYGVCFVSFYFVSDGFCILIIIIMFFIVFSCRCLFFSIVVTVVSISKVFFVYSYSSVLAVILIFIIVLYCVIFFLVVIFCVVFFIVFYLGLILYFVSILFINIFFLFCLNVLFIHLILFWWKSLMS